jgi:hypothetical protein
MVKLELLENFLGIDAMGARAIFNVVQERFKPRRCIFDAL